MKKDGRIFFDPGSLPPINSNCIKTLTEIIKEYETFAQPNLEFNKKRNESVDALKEICHNAYNGYANIYVFGSSINGFGTHMSDIDCFVIGNFDPNIKKSYFNPLLKALRQKGSGFTVDSFVRTSKLPVITVTHLQTEVAMDITFGSDKDCRIDVLENSALLNAYALQNPKVPAVGRFLKYILKHHQPFGSAKVGGLSSYCHVITLIYYMIHRHNLRHIETSKNRTDYTTDIDATEGEILMGFLKFYSCEFDSSKYAIDIRFPTRNTVAKNRDPSLLTVEDPFIDKNLGKSMAQLKTFEFKVFYYNLYCNLGNHPFSRKQLLEFIQNPSFDGMPIPPLNPECVPGREKVARPTRQNKQNTEGGGGKANNKRNQRRGRNNNSRNGDKNDNTTTEKPQQSNNVQEESNKAVKEAGCSSKIVDEDNGEDSSASFVSHDENFNLEDQLREIALPADSAVRLPRRLITSTLVRDLVDVSRDPELPRDWSVTAYLSDDTLSDTRSLVMVPLLAALGFKVPLFQQDTAVKARNIAKLMLLPGFNPNLSLSQLKSQLEDVGCFIGYCKELNVVEEKIQSIRTKIGKVSKPFMERARLFAPYISCGMSSILIDICCHGDNRSFKKGQEEIKQLKQSLRDLGVAGRIQISSSEVPYSEKMGLALELQDSLEILDGEGSAETVDIVATQAAHLLQINGIVKGLKEGEQKVFEVLSNGSAFSVFMEMLSAQGVTEDTIVRIKNKKFSEIWGKPSEVEKIFTYGPGIVQDINFVELKKIYNKLDSRPKNGASFGFEMSVNIGSRVNAEQPWLTVHHDDNQKLPKVTIRQLREAIDVEKIEFKRILKMARWEVPKKEKNDKEAEIVDTPPQDTPIVESVADNENPKDYVVVANVEDEEVKERKVEVKTEE